MAGMTDSANLTHGPHRGSAFDDPWKRLPIITITALAAWLVLLGICGMLLGGMIPGAAETPAIEAQLVILPGTSSAGRGSHVKESKYPGIEDTNNSVSAIGPVPQAVHHRSSMAAAYPVAPIFHALPAATRAKSSIREHRPHRRELARTKIDQAEHQDSAERPPMQNHAAPAAPANSVGQLAKAEAIMAPSVNKRIGPGSLGGGSSAEPASQAPPGANGGDSGNGYGPRPIYAPVPAIPDDMRDRVMEVTAVVRFHVARDGTAKVVLVTRTEYMTLDRLILDTLRNWRFQPAMRNGATVESDAEVRVRITVQ